jgi:hypothetical protein
MADDRLLRARDRLEQRVGDDPGVSLIDVGVHPDAPERRPVQLAVRVHVRSPDDIARLRAEGIEDAVEGVPVVLIRGDYRLEEGPRGHGER